MDGDMITVLVAIEAECMEGLLDLAGRLGRSFDQTLEQAICEFTAPPLREPLELQGLREELAIAEKLLDERNRLLEVIPPCPVHGSQCIPHAVEWVRTHAWNKYHDRGLCCYCAHAAGTCLET